MLSEAATAAAVGIAAGWHGQALAADIAAARAVAGSTAAVEEPCAVAAVADSTAVAVADSTVVGAVALTAAADTGNRLT
ncbi:MAG TPA: hypothetical protein VG267_18120 [Terracidiphilus sp.]|jgi:hypothetical protein|nr:hypothetical protein [Terracidiphilus sp.]